MTILNLYNVKTNSVVTEFREFHSKMFGLKVGDMYKVNLLVVSIVDIPQKPTPLKVIKRRIKYFRFDFGQFLIQLGRHIQKKYYK